MPDNKASAQGIPSLPRPPEQEAGTLTQERSTETVSQTPEPAQAAPQALTKGQNAPVQPMGPPATKPKIPQPEEPVPPEDIQAEQTVLEVKRKAGVSVPGAAPKPAPLKQPPPNYRITFSGDYFASGSFDQDISNYRAYAGRKTGYASLDAIQPLYPGLYLLGAISSLGKTTYTHQMADQIAAAGELVLYFSLEQNRFELYSKSIARQFFKAKQANNDPAPSSIDIRRGIPSTQYPNELANQIDQYAKSVGDRMIVIDGAFSMTVEDIEKVVEQCISGTKRKPVVVVDYLQIVAPSMSGRRKMDTKEAIDHIVHRLKALQSKYDLIVIVISSLNRQNYLTPIDFESFKESGGIEYTADVIWGLQLAVMSDELFGKEGKIKEKREKIRVAKSASPRAIDLVCVKNRYGQASYTTKFNYYPKSDTFEPCI